MKRFNYTAKTADGKVLRDSTEAEGRQSALSELRRKGLTVVNLMEIDGYFQSCEQAGRKQKDELRRSNRKRTGVGRFNNILLKPKRVRLSEMAVFCRQLAISINSGLSLREALDGIHQDMDVPALKKVLESIIKKLHNGVPFSKAVAEYPDVFSPVFIGMVHAAEEAGSLGETLDQLAGYLEASDQLYRKIKSLMAYPVFVAGFFLLICLIMVLGIVPRFQKIFGDLEADLPKFTQMVFAVNSFVVDQFPLIVGITAALFAVFFLYKKTELGALHIDRTKLRIPISGICLQRYIVARICRCLAIMLRSGVPISTALRIVCRIGDNRIIEKAIKEAHEKILSGSTIASGLDETKIFPALLIRMLGVGENAGRLPEVLDRVSDAYENQVEASIMTGMALLEPVIITVFGIMVLLLIISIYLPVFSVAAHV